MPLSSSEPSLPPPGVRRDLRQAREGAFASAAELREFVKGLRGKSPQEVLGAVANSGLAQGVALATAGTVVLMALFTIGPYFMYPKVAPKPAKVEAASTPEPAATGDTVANASTEKAAPDPKDAASNAQQTLDKLGESETKTADPKVNPLDNLDDLLDTKK